MCISTKFSRDAYLSSNSINAENPPTPFRLLHPHILTQAFTFFYYESGEKSVGLERSKMKRGEQKGDNAISFST